LISAIIDFSLFYLSDYLRKLISDFIVQLGNNRAGIKIAVFFYNLYS